MLHDGPVRAGADVDTAVLVFQAIARVPHNQAFKHHIGRLHAEGVAHQTATQGGPPHTAQGQRLVDDKIALVQPAGNFHHIARVCVVNHRLQGITGFDLQRGSVRTTTPQQAEYQSTPHQLPHAHH